MQDLAGFIDKLKAGDSAAWETAVNDNKSAIRGICGRILKDPEDIYDMMQNVFVKAFSKIGGFQGVCTLRTWMIRIAINECRMHLRTAKNKHYPRYSNSVRSEDEANLIGRKANLEDPLLRDVLYKCLNSLPVNYQLAVTLADIEGFEAKEIADMLDVTVPTVKSRIYRGRQVLREKLECLKIHAGTVARRTKRTPGWRRERSAAKLVGLPH